MGERISSLIGRFNSAYDFCARIVKFILFVTAAVLLMWKSPHVDWGRTSTGLVEKYTPLQVQQPHAPSGPPTSVVVASPPTAAPGPSPSPPATLAGRPAHPGPGEGPPNSPAPRPTSPQPDYLGIYQFGQLVFSTDRPYEITGDTVVFDKLLLKGKPDYEKAFLYAGAEIMIVHIETYIGLLVSGASVEGPVLKGVRSQVIRK